MSAAIDLELKKAFTELQQKLNDTTHKMEFCDAQIEKLTIERTLHRKMLDELNQLSNDTVVYEAVGRTFFTNDLKESRKSMSDYTKRIGERIREIEQKKNELQNSVAESERKVREMIEKNNQN